jgi:hypothetical protein
LVVHDGVANGWTLKDKRGTITCCCRNFYQNVPNIYLIHYIIDTQEHVDFGKYLACTWLVVFLFSAVETC